MKVNFIARAGHGKRPLLVAGKPELRRYKGIYVQADEQVGLFGDEIVVNCQP